MALDDAVAAPRARPARRAAPARRRRRRGPAGRRRVARRPVPRAVPQRREDRRAAAQRPGLGRRATSPPSGGPRSRRRPTRRRRRRRAARCARSPTASVSTTLDVDILLAAMAPDVDDRFERYYGYLNDDVTRRRVSVGLALGLAGVDAVERRRPAPLRGRRPRSSAAALLEVEDPDRPFLTRPLRVPDRVTAHVLGADEPDAALGLRAASTSRRPPSRRTQPLVRALAERGAARLRPRPRGGRRRSRSSTPPPRPACRRSSSTSTARRRDADADRVVAAAVREARLRGGVLVAGPVDELAETQRRRRSSGSPASPVPLVLYRPPRLGPGVGRRGRRSSSSRRGWRAGGRARLWASALDGHAGDASTRPATVGQYRLGAGQIRRAAEAAVARRPARRTAPVGDADVRLGARQQNAARPRAPRPPHRARRVVGRPRAAAGRRRRPAQPRRPGPPPRAGARRVADAAGRRSRAPGSRRCSPATPAPARR